MKFAERLLAGGVGLLIAVLLLVVVGVALLAFGETGHAAPVATLSVYVGTAGIQRAGSSSTNPAHTGDTVAAGDTVSTGTNSKAGLTYPDGSLTRLDSDTKVRISLARAGLGGVQTGVNQSAGLTWNKVVKLLGGASFKVSGPNSANASVRGTRFGYYVEHDPAGAPVIWIDTYDGVVQVTGATGTAVTATANTRVTVRANAAPTAPAPIPATDLQLSFTVFNQTLDSVTGKPYAFQSGTLSSGQATSFGVTADGKSNVQLVLGWPASTYQLTVVDPSGKTVSTTSSSKPPLVVTVPKPAKGTYRVTVTDVQSSPGEAWWLIAART